MENIEYFVTSGFDSNSAEIYKFKNWCDVISFLNDRNALNIDKFTVIAGKIILSKEIIDGK